MLRGFAVAFAFFAGSFALHIVAGANDIGWLFMTAVVLIFFAASGFAAIAYLASTRTARLLFARPILVIGIVAGTVLTSSALWAANDRTVAWWEPLGGFCATVLVSSALLILAGKQPHRLLAKASPAEKAGRVARKAASLR